MKKTTKKSLIKKKTLFDHIKQITSVQNPKYWDEISEEDREEWKQKSIAEFEKNNTD